MNKLRQYLIITVLLVKSFGCLLAQDTTQFSIEDSMLDLVKEHTTICTDRSIYAAGEDIFFNIKSGGNLYDNTTLSGVVYVELISSAGFPICQLKLLSDDYTASGCIQVAEGLNTGYYYLRAYTKLMCNESDIQTVLKEIKIINPNDEIIALSSMSSSDSSVEKDYERISGLQVALDKDIYQANTPIEVSFNVDKTFSKIEDYSVSVVRKGAIDLSYSVGQQETEKVTEERNHKFYLPEKYGIIITGRVFDALNQKPTGFAQVDLALIGGSSYLCSCQADIDGYFSFSIPKTYHAQDFYIYAQKGDLELDIKVDNDFCWNDANIIKRDFILSKEEQKLVDEICVNAQISQRFDVKNHTQDLVKESNDVSYFYGTPFRTYLIQDYIDLKSLQDFFQEVIIEAVVADWKLMLSYNSQEVNTLGSLPYLVLLDNVPIEDQEKLLKLSPRKIERIELIKSGYLVGNKSYCGVVSIFSNNNDMAGIQLPKNSMFFQYGMYSEMNQTISVNDLISTPSGQLPDRRNCLYWNPSLEVLPKAETKIKFMTADVEGDYQIIVQGVDRKTGEIKYCEETFTVKK